MLLNNGLFLSTLRMTGVFNLKKNLMQGRQNKSDDFRRRTLAVVA